MFYLHVRSKLENIVFVVLPYNYINIWICFASKNMMCDIFGPLKQGKKNGGQISLSFLLNVRGWHRLIQWNALNKIVIIILWVEC